VQVVHAYLREGGFHRVEPHNPREAAVPVQVPSGWAGVAGALTAEPRTSRQATTGSNGFCRLYAAEDGLVTRRDIAVRGL
jgi:hypothetical protein